MGIPGNKSRLKEDWRRISEAWHRATLPAGPAGLAAAIRAKQRAEALGQELNVGRLKAHVGRDWTPDLSAPDGV